MNFFYAWFYMCCILAAGIPSRIMAAPKTLSLYARDGVSCPNNTSMLTAHGKVMIRHEDLTIYADVVHVHFSCKKKKALNPERSSKLSSCGIHRFEQIKSIHALGHVMIHTAQNTLSAHQAMYCFSHKKISAKGSNIQLKNKKWTLCAHESLTYCQKTGYINAMGQVRLTKETQGIESQHLRAGLVMDSSNNAEFSKKLRATHKKHIPMTLQWIHSPTSIRIWDTQKEYVMRANTGLFYFLEKKLHLCGNVKILYKKKYVTADQAMINFNNHTIHIPRSAHNIRAYIPTESSNGKNP